MSENELTSPDPAISKRLARLREMPVDLSRLEARLKPVLKADANITSRPRWNARRYAVAASLAALGILIGILVALHPRPHTVSAADLTQVNVELRTEQHMATPVHTIEEANRVLRTQWADAPVVAQVGQPLKSCCLHQVCGKCVACVSLNTSPAPTTVMLGRASDLRVPDWQIVARNGLRCRCYSSPNAGNGVNVVAMERNGVSIFVFGHRSVDDLLATAAEIRL